MFCLVTLLLPGRSASAAEQAATAAAASATETLGNAAAAAAGYASNAPVSALTVSRPISTAAELQLTGRLVCAAALGAVIGKERSGKTHHPAGVRTMALVATGAACFTVCSMYGFSAAGRYDPSRMASNVASGVGFIGAGVITTTGSSSNRSHQKAAAAPPPGGSIVHGLTTAAAIWLSAAVGVGCGVGMCILATAAALLTVSVLRIGRWAQTMQQRDWMLDELRRSRRQRRKQQRHKRSSPTSLELLRRDIGKAIWPPRSLKINGDYSVDGESEDEDDQHDVVDDVGDNELDVYEEKEDQLIFHDERPPTGWNETDAMDA